MDTAFNGIEFIRAAIPGWRKPCKFNGGFNSSLIGTATAQKNPHPKE
jgi:hypothetical protein